MIKLIVSDLDGTLFDRSHMLDETTAKTIKKAQSAGYEFMVATGRNSNCVLPLFKKHGIECNCILLNGAVYQDKNGKVLQQIPLSNSLAKDIMELLEAHQIYAHIYTREGIATMHPEEIKQDFISRMKDQVHMSDEEVEEILMQADFISYNVLIESIDSYFATSPTVYKIEAFCNDDAIIDQARMKLNAIKDIAISNSIGNNFEVTDIKAQKGIMLEHLLPSLGYQKEEVIFFGDSMNDLSVMERFPYTVAMENAMEEIKAAASYQIGNCIDHAVASAIEELIKSQII